MTIFLQYHFLTSYAAANLNRDDAGRPKTLHYGGAERLRISSQSLKRAWRCSEEFKTAMGEAIGVRSQRFAEGLYDALIAKGLSPEDAIEKTRAIVDENKIGKLEKYDPKSDDFHKQVHTNQLVHLSQSEIDGITNLADQIMSDEDIKKFDPVYEDAPHAVDIALFGRMLASAPEHNVEAACQVAHAFTTHRVTVEDDFYTAVDDMKTDSEDDAGAGFLGVHDYGAGVFYTYVCLNTDLLLSNLDNADLASSAAVEMVKSMLTVSPTGKQNSYASRARASFCMVEAGPQTPRSLGEAFITPISGTNLIADSIKALDTLKENFSKAYGEDVEQSAQFTVGGTGTQQDILDLTAQTIATKAKKGS